MSGWTSIRFALASCAALAVCAPLAACQTPLEKAYGISQRAHTAQMVEDPEAGVRNRDVAHPDGTTAASATGKMRTKEKRVPAASTEKTVINVGGGSSR
jgi:type IV pilus biogenesis protein CpaD/CtpE